MNFGKTLFAQTMEFLPWTSFARIVSRYGGDSRVRNLSCTEQFRAMAFAQLTGRESLRGIETCLLANQAKLYGMGFRAPVRRSTLADANEGRDWRIWSDLAALLIPWASSAAATSKAPAANTSPSSRCPATAGGRGYVLREIAQIRQVTHLVQFAGDL